MARMWIRPKPGGGFERRGSDDATDLSSDGFREVDAATFEAARRNEKQGGSGLSDARLLGLAEPEAPAPTYWTRSRPGGGFDRAGASGSARPDGDGWQQVDLDTFRAARRHAEGGTLSPRDAQRLGLPETEAEADFRAGAPAAAAAPRFSTPAESDFRTGAAAQARAWDPGDAKRDGLSNPSARPAQDWRDGPRNPSPMPRSGGRGQPQVQVGRVETGDPTGFVGRQAASGRNPPNGGAARPWASKYPEVAAYMQQRMQQPQDELGEARARADRGLLFSRLGRAGAMLNENLTGAKYDRAAYDDLDASAQQPVADLMARRGMAREDAEDGRRADETRWRRETDVRDFEYQQGRDRAQDELASRRLSADERRAAEDRTYRWAALREQRSGRKADEQARADARAEERAAKERNMKERQTEKDLKDVGVATSKAPFGELQSALQQVEQRAPGIAYGQTPARNPLSTRDRIARAVPFGAGEWAMSDEGKRYASEIANLRDLISRARSGAVLNEGEERHYRSLLGDEILSDPAKAASGINAVRQGIAQKLRNAQAPYARIQDPGEPSVLDAYEQEGGTTYRAPIFGQYRGPVLMQAPDGRRYEVDADEVDEATRNGWKVLNG